MRRGHIHLGYVPENALHDAEPEARKSRQILAAGPTSEEEPRKRSWWLAMISPSFPVVQVQRFWELKTAAE